MWLFMSGQTIAGDIIVCSDLEHFGITIRILFHSKCHEFLYISICGKNGIAFER